MENKIELLRMIALVFMVFCNLSFTIIIISKIFRGFSWNRYLFVARKLFVVFALSSILFWMLYFVARRQPNVLSVVKIEYSVDTLLSCYSADSSLALRAIMSPGQIHYSKESSYISGKWIVYICKYNHYMHIRGIRQVAGPSGTHFICPKCGNSDFRMEYTDNPFQDTNDVYYEKPIFIKIID